MSGQWELGISYLKRITPACVSCVSSAPQTSIPVQSPSWPRPVITSSINCSLPPSLDTCVNLQWGPQMNFSYKYKTEVYLKSAPGTVIPWGQKKQPISWALPPPSLPCKGVLTGGDAHTPRPQNFRTIRKFLGHGSRWGQCGEDEKN